MNSHFSLLNKKILITGASSGIGRATAIMAAEMGAEIYGIGRDKVRLDDLATTLNGVGHHFFQCDLIADDQIEGLVQKIPKIDGAVFCAGVTDLIPFRMITQAHIDKIMGLNFTSPIILTQKILQNKKLNPSSSLVYLTAVAEKISPTGSAIYSASKAALSAAIRSLALEIAKNKSRANCVSPGYVDTPMLQDIKKTSRAEELTDLQPLGVIAPEEVAASVVYLLSSASKWVTRTTLTVDAGISLPAR